MWLTLWNGVDGKQTVMCCRVHYCSDMRIDDKPNVQLIWTDWSLICITVRLRPCFLTMGMMTACFSLLARYLTEVSGCIPATRMARQSPVMQ
jgi:hypothetical protein